MPSFSRYDVAPNESGDIYSDAGNVTIADHNDSLAFDAELLREMDAAFADVPPLSLPPVHNEASDILSAENAFAQQPPFLSENMWAAFDAAPYEPHANFPAVPVFTLNAEVAVLEQAHKDWHGRVEHNAAANSITAEEPAVMQAKQNHVELKNLWDYVHYRSLENDLLPVPPLPDDALLRSGVADVLAVQERSKEALLAKRMQLDSLFALPDSPLVSAVLNRNNATIVEQGQHLAQLRGQNWAGQRTAEDVRQGWSNPYAASSVASRDALNQSGRSVQNYIDDQITMMKAQNLDIEERLRFLDAVPKHARETIRTLDFPGRHSRARYNRPLMQDGRPVVFVYFDVLAQKRLLVDLRAKPDAQPDDEAFHALIGGGKAAYTSAISSKVSKDKKRKQAESNAELAHEHKEKKRAENTAYLQRVEASADRLTRHRQSRQDAQARYRENVRAQRELHKNLETVSHGQNEQ